MAIAMEENFSASQDRVHVWINGRRVLDEVRVFGRQAITDVSELRFGAQQGQAAAAPFAGFIDEVRIYDRFLDDEQVRAVYEIDAASAN